MNAFCSVSSASHFSRTRAIVGSSAPGCVVGDVPFQRLSQTQSAP